MTFVEEIQSIVSAVESRRNEILKETDGRKLSGGAVMKKRRDDLYSFIAKHPMSKSSDCHLVIPSLSFSIIKKYLYQLKDEGRIVSEPVYAKTGNIKYVLWSVAK
jgi:hypothetical protein